MQFFRRRSMQLAVDALVITLALLAAYVMRFEAHLPRTYLKQLLLILPYVVILRIGLFTVFGVYRLVWRYISLRDLPRIVTAVAAGTAVLVLARFAIIPLFALADIKLNPTFSTVPLGVLAAELVFTTVGLIAVRSLWRLRVERLKQAENAAQAPPQSRPRVRALLLGAGSAGVMVAREVATRPDVGFEVVGFLDDDASKHGSLIHGYKVLGGTERIAELAEATGAQMAVITMASVPAASVRRIIDQAKEAGLKVQIIPGLYEILSGRVNISKIRDVAIEDLLGRAAVKLDEELISGFLTDKTVLITGAGGSIGSEMARQVGRYRPARLVLVEQAENPLFHIHRELLALYPDVPLDPVVANVVNRERLGQVFARYAPQVVIHAAAHKHVPLMELHPGEAVRNNIGGSRNVADLADVHGAEAMVMISTDKAVNPTSVMGATKRVAEMYVQALSQRSSTRFITVRFGNVLGSEGSVVPIFKEQIARGGPVTVTHPEMKRYFMTIPEASQLVLQSAAMGSGGEIFVLEMGQPTLIANLARDLIRLSGYRPDEEIKIDFTGVRPGEKLYEEINLSEEHATKTLHPRIWIGHCQLGDRQKLMQSLQGLVGLVESGEAELIRERLTELVPEYQQSAPAAAAASGDRSGSAAAGAVAGAAVGA